MDERRRRRLAQEAEPESLPERRPGPRTRTVHRKDSENCAEARRSASPVESLLRPQLWFNILLAVIVAGMSAAAIWLGWHVDTARPALSGSLGLKGGLLGRAIVACHFLLAAQLGYVILWYRARSRKDFRGQYILWRWVEPTWLLFALASAIDGRTLIQELVLPRISARIWHVETMCWMVPAGILVLTATRFLLYDMREDRLGVAFVVLSGLGAAAAALTVLAGPLLAVDLNTLHVLQQASLNVWSLGALLSMLFHARYVIHVTNEAPRPERRGRMAAILGHLIPKMPRLRRAATADERRNADPKSIRELAAQERATPHVDQKTSTADNPKPAESIQRVDPADETPSVPGQKPESRETPTDGTPTRQPLATTPPANPASDDIDSAPVSGLSKKERRRLRKQRRKQQGARQPQL